MSIVALENGLRESTEKLDKSVERFRKSANLTSWTMIVLAGSNIALLVYQIFFKQ